jgi:hypothetical protein
MNFHPKNFCEIFNYFSGCKVSIKKMLNSFFNFQKYFILCEIKSYIFKMHGSLNIDDYTCLESKELETMF